MIRSQTSRTAALAGVLALALLLRLAAGAWWQTRLVAPDQFGFGDSDGYWRLGQAIATGAPYEYGAGRRVFRAPGYPLVLAPLFLLGGADVPVWTGFATSALLGTLAVALVYLLGSWLFDPRVGLVAAALVAVYPGAVAMGTFVLSEAPFAPLMLLQLALWARAWQRRGTMAASGAALAAGLAGALATLMRPSWLLFTPLAMVVAWACFPPRAQQGWLCLWVAVGLVGGMLPWWIRNARVTGHFVPTTLQVGASLLDAWHDQATGASQMDPVDRVAEEELASLNRVPEWEREYQLDARLRARAVDWARQHPARVLQLAAIKFARLWNLWPNEAQFRAWPLRLAVALGYVPLLALGLAGAWRFRGQGWPVVLCCLPAVYLSLLHTVFVSSIRYREPAMLALAVLAAAYGVDRWGTTRREDAPRRSPSA